MGACAALPVIGQQSSATGILQQGSSGAAPVASQDVVQLPAAQSSGSGFQGSVVSEKATDSVLQLTLEGAIQKGLKYNLGLILSGTNVQSANGQRLQQLQALLPTVDASAKEAVQQINLQALGLTIPGISPVLGPFAYTDIRGTLNWSLLNVSSLQNYLSSRHNFQASKLSAEDARDMVILTVGNAYLLVIADASRIQTAQAQVDTSKVSLDQAVANHQSGTAPLLDELRARVDYQTQQQSLISARNQFEKDKIALARTIGLPLEQKFEIADQVPYAALDNLDVDIAVKQALANRKDLQAMNEQTIGAEKAYKGATAERLPTISFEGDYGVIGPQLGNSHGTGNAVGTASVPVFDEARLRGDARAAEAQLNQKNAQLSDLRAQVSADVRDSILDIQSAARQVEVARSNVQLATEALSEAQQRYAAGVSDNLAVSQAQQAVAQADDQYVSSLYQHNIAKLSLARALGVAQNYKDYVGGK
jgi:outer membrane protein TolC